MKNYATSMTNIMIGVVVGGEKRKGSDFPILDYYSKKSGKPFSVKIWASGFPNTSQTWYLLCLQ
jgi:hypothetical protein